ncbi:hypothetical protein JST56_04550 [Candidatus Dependentiae bacterium]|jgi:hypothetical protein|nr:hypothetical protein [Candidatus Dependentiae bacterium]
MKLKFYTVILSGSFLAAIALTQCSASKSNSMLRSLAQWSVLTYIQGDNNLDPFAYFNVKAMQKGVRATDQVHALVQWDRPNDNKTWRFRITPGGKIEDESLSSEMGYHPRQELVDSMQWVVNSYPALHYGLILWNHGSGVEDYSPGSRQKRRYYSKWLQLVGTSPDAQAERGVLYDDSQGTCLTNSEMSDALRDIKGIIGRNLDLLGMDACLMAMFEIAYEVKDFVDYFVASQELEPGEGWEYTSMFNALTTMPTITPAQLAKTIVTGYARYYRKRGDTADFTMSAFDLTQVTALDIALSRIITTLNEARKLDPIGVKSVVRKARAASLQMDVSEYIDMGTFFAELSKRFGDKGRDKEPAARKRLAYNKSTKVVRSALSSGLAQINNLIIGNATGPLRARARGVSIYYPSKGAIHSSYRQTAFAQNSNWLNFLKQYAE